MAFNSEPVHNNIQLANSGSSYTNLVSFYAPALMGYTDVALANSGTSYTSLKPAGYQYLLGYITHIFEETVSTTDSMTQDILMTWEEDIPVNDVLNNGYSQLTDTVPVYDDFVSQITVYWTDTVPVNDELSSLKSFDELAPIYDEFNVTIVKTFTDYANSVDEVLPFLYFDAYDSTTVQVQQNFDLYDTTVLEVSSTFDVLDTTNIGVVNYSVPVTTNPSSVSNPFTPTIIVGGTVYTYNAATAPPSYNSQTSAAWVNNIAFGGINLCDIYDYNISLDGSGGTWDIFANAPVGALNTVQSICGLSGTVCRIKQEFVEGKFGYRTSGIFGNPQMARPLNMIGDPLLFQLLTNPRTGIKPAEFFSTYAGAARSIGNTVGSNVNWYIADFPYIETFSQEGASVMDALNSVVTTVGGSLRWNGDNGYNAVYPPRTIGTFSIPTWQMMTAANGETIYDISTGTAGVGSFGFQVYTNNIALGLGLPVDTIPDNQYNIMPVFSTSKAYTIQDPATPIKVDADAVEAYVQILVQENFAGTAAYLTANEDEWFSLGSPSISNPYFKPSYGLGEQYKLNVYCANGLFPANSDPINNGNFTLRLGIRKYDPRAEFFAGKDLRDAQIRNQIARTVGQMRFVRNYVVNVSTPFFGAIPLPGMKLEDLYPCGTNTIAGGVIESVSLVSPGILSIQAAQYAQIDFHANLAGYSIQNPIPGG